MNFYAVVSLRAADRAYALVTASAFQIYIDLDDIADRRFPGGGSCGRTYVKRFVDALESRERRTHRRVVPRRPLVVAELPLNGDRPGATAGGGRPVVCAGNGDLRRTGSVHAEWRDERVVRTHFS